MSRVDAVEKVDKFLKPQMLKLVTQLDTKSNNDLFQFLSEIKVNTINHRNLTNRYLCEMNVFEKLAQFLKLPNDGILNVTLSILANTSMFDDSRKQISKTDVVISLISILKNIANESIQNRACRLAANLAMSRHLATELVLQNIILAIVNVLNTSTCVNTHISAIRALRLLYENNNSVMRQQFFASNAITIVAEKLKSAHKGVVHYVLKALNSFTRCFQFECAKKIQSIEGGSGLAVLMSLNDVLSYKIVHNLSECSRTVTFLNECEVLPLFIKLLILPENKNNELLKRTLCNLCCDVSGSVRLLAAENGVTVFLNIFEDPLCGSIRRQVYTILYKHIFDPHSLLKLTKFGLVRILIARLDSFVKQHGKVHETAVNVVPMKPARPSGDNKILFIDDHLEKDILSSYGSRLTTSGCMVYDNNMLSTIGGNLSPVCSQRSLSPPLSGADEEDESAMAVYSPICSFNEDNSGEGVLVSNSDNKADASSDVTDCSDGEDPNSFRSVEYCLPGEDLLPFIQRNDEKKLKGEISGKNGATSSENMLLKTEREDLLIVQILLKISYLHVTVDYLSSKETVATLTQYIAKTDDWDPNITRFFRSLLVKDQYYCYLLDSYFALHVHRKLCRPIHSHCIHCNDMRILGERILQCTWTLSDSGLGEGQMAYRLLTSNDETKFQVALTVPLVSGNLNKLRILLIKHKALDIIIEKLVAKDVTETTLEDIACSLQMLFRKLKCHYREESGIVTEKRCSGCDIEKFRKASTIAFRMDDGSIVHANKSTLREKCPFFDAMLNGNFKESDQEEIRISGVTSACMERFVKILDTYCECILPRDINVLLELISLSDRYLVSELLEDILEHVMTYEICATNCEIIFRWATECKLSIGEKIMNDVIKYLFTSRISKFQLQKGLLNFVNSVCKDEFIEKTIYLIKDVLLGNSLNKPYR